MDNLPSAREAFDYEQIERLQASQRTAAKPRARDGVLGGAVGRRPFLVAARRGFFHAPAREPGFAAKSVRRARFWCAAASRAPERVFLRRSNFQCAGLFLFPPERAAPLFPFREDWGL